MARKVLTYTVPADGPERDRGKVYVITEMPAAQAEKWAMRALLALANNGVEVPDELLGGGMAAIAAMGLKIFVKVPFYEAEPLLDEMMECVKIAPDNRPAENVRPLIADDIEEVLTRVKLREEVLSLHLGFSIAAKLSELREAAMKLATLQNTETSPA